MVCSFIAEGTHKRRCRIAVKASAVLVTKGFTKMDRSKIGNWIKAAVEKDDGRSTYEIAHTCKNYLRLPHTMFPMVKRAVRTSKDNFRVKKWKSKKAGTSRTRPSYNTSVTERLVAEGLYSVDLPPAGEGLPYHPYKGGALPGAPIGAGRKQDRLPQDDRIGEAGGRWVLGVLVKAGYGGGLSLTRCGLIRRNR